MAGEEKKRPANEKASIKPVSEEVVPERSYIPLAEATPTPRYLYLLRPASVTTEVGIIGIPPGTRLALLEEREEGFRVSNGKAEFIIGRDVITFNHKEATAAYEAYVETQKQVQAEIRQKLEEAHKAEMERRLKMKGMTD
ncbi:MAG TPA: hypothetical protein VNQ90_17105 [Chthoniobacteraceae bacterium]|nr:hypothetical protein [Chthoniobacteraceae bacterium]